MTVEEFENRWLNWMIAEGRVMKLEDINNFCNDYATNYEEYMSMVEIAKDFFEGFEGMPER